MAIGIVNDDELQAELDRLNGSIKKEPVVQPVVIEEIEKGGRNEGDVNVPDSLRQIIGETSVIDGRQDALALANMFGISASAVSAYAKGSTSTASYDSPAKSIISHINKSRQRYTKKAGKVLHEAMQKIDENKLNDMSAKELAGIAKDMSVVIKNLEPQQAAPGEDGQKTPQFVIFAPQFRDERTFPTMVLEE